MTTETTLTGRELDAWLAEHLFGLPVRLRAIEAMSGPVHGTERPVVDRGMGHEPIAPYSSTGDGMLLVLEAMRERGYVVQVFGTQPGAYGDGVWIASIDELRGPTRETIGSAVAQTAPRAVAEAAKAALEAQA